MAALIPMCGIRNLRQLSSLACVQLSSIIDTSRAAQNQKTLKPTKFPIRPCKCLYSTASSSSNNDEMVDKSKQTDSSDDSSKDKAENKKPPFMKKYAKTIFWSSAVMGTFTLGMLIKRWGRLFLD